MTEKKSVALGTPVTIGELEVSALKVTVPFRNGFLRGAPPTPQWFISTVQRLFAAGAAIDQAKIEEIDDADLLKDVDVWPQGSDIDAMIPWLLHIAEKATGQPADVIDQLAIDDMVKIIMLQLPGMMKIVNFQKTSANGALTSQGSLDGAPPK
jgi:hypothetical protein